MNSPEGRNSGTDSWAQDLPLYPHVRHSTSTFTSCAATRYTVRLLRGARVPHTCPWLGRPHVRVAGSSTTHNVLAGPLFEEGGAYPHYKGSQVVGRVAYGGPGPVAGGLGDDSGDIEKTCPLEKDMVGKRVKA